MDNKRASKLVKSLRRGNVLINGVTDQYWHEKTNELYKRVY